MCITESERTLRKENAQEYIKQARIDINVEFLCIRAAPQTIMDQNDTTFKLSPVRIVLASSS